MSNKTTNKTKNKTKDKFTKREKTYALIGLVAVVVILVIFLSIAIPYFVNRKKSAYNSKYEYDGASLVGKWQERDNFNDEIYKTYEYLDNGKVITTMYVYGIEKVKDTTSTYRVEGKNTLIITYTVGQTLQNAETKFSISEDNSTLVLKDGKNFTILEKYNLEYNKDTSVFGEWVNVADENDTMTLNSDHTGVMKDKDGTNRIVFSTNGDNFYYFIDEYMQIQGYTLTAEFVINAKFENGNIVVPVKDGNVVYTRK